MDIHALLIQIQEALDPKDGADVVSNFYSEREGGKPTRKKVKKKVGKLSPQERVLLRQMQLQSATARGRARAKYGSDMVPQPPAPKPFNFREFVEVDEIARNPDYISPQKAAQDMANAKALAKAMLKYDAMMKKKGKKKPPPTNEGVDIQGLLRKHRAGKKIGVTNLNRLKARGLVKRADGTKVDKGNRGKS